MFPARMTQSFGDFEKPLVYQKAKSFNAEIYQLIKSSKNPARTPKDQFRIASFSLMLNIAEGAQPTELAIFNTSSGFLYRSLPTFGGAVLDKTAKPGIKNKIARINNSHCKPV